MPASYDLADLVVKGLLCVEGAGKATRSAIAMYQWVQPVVWSAIG